MNSPESSKKTLSLITILLLCASNIIVSSTGKSDSTIIVPDQYPTITSAIENASPGEKIYIKTGVYHENLIIEKPLSIIGENKENVIIIGKGNLERGKQTVISLQANHVNIQGLTIKSQNYSNPSHHATGISVEGDNCTITENIITNTFLGIFSSVQSNLKISKNLGNNFKYLRLFALRHGRNTFWVTQNNRRVYFMTFRQTYFLKQIRVSCFRALRHPAGSQAF